ncbi:MAG: superoxide dismutase [Cytophagales bacterium]|nr:superoxide dismutase [Rhizobacter sp.]
MDYQLRPLTLDLNKLDGLSQRLVASHHENNYAGAVKRLNAIRKQLGELDWATAPVFTVNGLKREELVAANSAVLHELYFDCLGGDGVVPASGLYTALERDFGSVDRWRAEFMALAKAMGGGSGWALMSWSSRESRLLNHWAADHTQLLAGATPVLALDMHEHAYHMDFGAKAAAYVDTFMQNIRWEGVYCRYREAVATDAAGWSTELQTLAADAAKVRILDIRRPEHLAQATETIAGAQWCDPGQVDRWSLELDPSQPVVVCCVHGLDIGRSTALALRARGFDARFLTGGIEAWRNAGLPVQPKGES